MDATMIDFLLKAAERAHPHEACGIIVGETAYEITNRSNHPSEFFEMDLDELRELTDHGRPTGLWHSHPRGNPNPSTADLEHHPPGMRLIIVARGQVHDHGVIK